MKNILLFISLGICLKLSAQDNLSPSEWTIEDSTANLKGTAFLRIAYAPSGALVVLARSAESSFFRIRQPNKTEWTSSSPCNTFVATDFCISNDGNCIVVGNHASGQAYIATYLF